MSVFSGTDTFSPFNFFCPFSLTPSTLFQHYFFISAGVSQILSNDFLRLHKISILSNHKKSSFPTRFYLYPNLPERSQAFIPNLQFFPKYRYQIKINITDIQSLIIYSLPCFMRASQFPQQSLMALSQLKAQSPA